MLRLLLTFTAAAIGLGVPQAHSATAYNTFLEAPQRCCQEPGFGYYGGAQVTTSIFGVSFIPTVSGAISDVWIAVGSSLSDVGTDLFDIIIATSGSQMEPDLVLAAATVQGELSKRESVVQITSDSPDVLIDQGVMYWMLIAPGAGTPEVGWLGGPPNSPPGAYSAYPFNTPSGWFISAANANGAMRIDVVAIPEPSTAATLVAGGALLLLVFGRRVRRTGRR